MLQYFRINDPYRLLGVLVIMLLIGLPLLIDSPGMTYPELKNLVVGEKVHHGSALYTELVDSGGPLAGWFNGLLDMVFGRSLLARHILAFIVIFFQASYLGIVFASKKAFSENTYIPSLLFAIFSFFSFDTLSLTPELLGAGFLLLALNNLFTEIEFRAQRNETIFNLGLYIGLASLFSFSYSVYLIGALIVLIIFTRHTSRKYVLLVVGFFIPHFFLITVYYLKEGLSELWQYYYLPNLGFHATNYVSSGSLWFLSAVPLFFLVISLIMLNREARFTKYQSQLVQCMFLWMIFSILQVFYSKDWRPQSFITLIPSLSFFIAQFLLLIRRRKFAEMSTWVMLVGVVSISYLARYDNIGSVNYARLFVPDPPALPQAARVLVLDDDWSVYKQHPLGSAFFNWSLSKDIFAHAEYYDNVIQVYEGIKSDPPSVIRDKNDLFGPFLERIPEFKKMYVRKGEYYTTVSN